MRTNIAVSTGGISFANWRVDIDIRHTSTRYYYYLVLPEILAHGTLFSGASSIQYSLRPEKFRIQLAAGRNAQQYMSSVLCAGVTAGVAAAVKANGR